jgi:hypothetical protein
MKLCSWPFEGCIAQSGSAAATLRRAPQDGDSWRISRLRRPPMLRSANSNGRLGVMSDETVNFGRWNTLKKGMSGMRSNPCSSCMDFIFPRACFQGVGDSVAVLASVSGPALRGLPMLRRLTLLLWQCCGGRCRILAFPRDYPGLRTGSVKAARGAVGGASAGLGLTHYRDLRWALMLSGPSAALSGTAYGRSHATTPSGRSGRGVGARDLPYLSGLAQAATCTQSTIGLFVACTQGVQDINGPIVLQVQIAA